MTILLIGLNHRTAPVEIREQLALSGCGLSMALEDMQLSNAINGNGHKNGTSSVIREGVILSTCNRLEIYAVVKDVDAGEQAIIDFLTRLQGIPAADLLPHLYVMEGREAVTHLMRVAAGLDSMILGEPQILGQVTQAYGDAQAAQATGPLLSHLFAQAIHAGKRARTETDISRHTTSVSHAAALLVQDTLGDVTEANVLVIGAGEMALLAVKALQAHGAANFTCINRTHARAEELASEIGARAMNWYHQAEALTWADVAISATGAPHTIIHKDDVEGVLEARAGRPLLFVDIAVPRDIEEAVGDLPDVHRCDIDDLQATLDENLAQRKAAIPFVEDIIAGEVECFLEWLHGREVVPVIADLRRWASGVAADEVEQALNRLGDLDDHQEDVVNQLAHRIINKLLHEPTVRLKAHAAEGNGYQYAHTMRDLFALQSQPENKNGHREQVAPAQEREKALASD